MSAASTRRRRIWPWVAAGVLAVPVACVAAGAYFLSSLDPDSLKPRIEAMATRALHREVRINGDLALSVLPTPSLSASGLRVGRLASAQSMNVTLALAPLLRGRIVLDTISLDRPLLHVSFEPALHEAETSRPAGRQTDPDAAAPGIGAPRIGAPGIGAPGHRRIDIRRLDVSDATVILPDGRSVTGINAQLSQRDGILTFAAQGTLPPDQGAEAGALAALQGTLAPADAEAGHVQASLSAPGLALAVDGTLGIAARRFDGTITASAADLAPAASLVGRYVPLPSLPALHGVTMSAHASGNWHRPSFSGLHLAVGASPLDGVMPGLALTGGTIDAAAPEGPYDAAGSLMVSGQPVALAVTLAALPGVTPAMLTLHAAAAGGRLDAHGTLGWPIARQPLSLHVDAHADDLARMAAAFHRVLPAGSADVSGTFDAPAAPADGWTVTGLTLNAPFGELHGTIGHERAPRSSWQASLTTARLDLDSLLATVPATRAQALSGAPQPEAAPAPPQGPRERVIPDLALPASWLRANDAKLAIAATHLTLHGVPIDDLNLAATLAGGHVEVDRAEARGPAGRVSLHLQADAADDPVQGRLALHIPEASLGPLLTAFGLPGDSEGTLRLDAELAGRGDDTGALAASLSGKIGLAAGPGQIDNRVVEALFGRALRAASLPAELSGRSQLRCLAAAATLNDGKGDLTHLALDTTRLALDGNGAFDLGRETLDLHLKPLLRLGRGGAAIPVHVVGRFADPKTSLDASGPDGRVSLLLGALTGDVEQASPCGVAATTAPPQPSPQGKAKGLKGADLLRKLLR